MTETSGGSASHDPYGTASDTTDDASRGQAGREWLTQLQSMIDNVATTAGPVLRDVAAKAAELAAAAGEKAGPIAHRAADATEAAGQKLAERGREVAAEMRRAKAAEEGNGGGAGEGETPNAIDPARTPAAGTTPSPTGVRPDTPDTLGE